MSMIKPAQGLPFIIAEFKWPAPAYLAFLQGQDQAPREQCLVTLAGGQK